MEEIIQEALGKGVEMHVAGELDLASQLYASVIKLQPNHADANHNMGLLKVDKGQDLEALPYLQTALQADPSIAQFWLSYIRALIKLDRVDEAARILSLAQESGVKSEEFLELHQQLNGLASIEKEVQSQSGASTQSNPNIGSHGPPQEAINQLANLYNQGQLSAVVEQAQALVEQYPSAFIVWNILGAANKGLGQVDEAVRAFQKVTELNPTYADGFNNLGATLHDQGKAEEAIEAYKSAISLHPDDTKVHYNMGVTLQEYGKLDEALEAYSKAIALKPDYASAFNNMATVLRDQNKLDEAILAYKKVLSIEPDNADAYNNMGVALKEQGNLEEAIEALKKAILLNPDNADAHRNLSDQIKYRPNDPQLNTISELIKRTDFADGDKCQLHYAAAKMSADLGELKASFEHYVTGGALRKKILSYDLEQDELVFAQIKNIAPRLKKFSLDISSQVTTPNPVFILGMPRSGTSLIEQIISCHSQVHGAGELPFLHRFGGKLSRGLQDIKSGTLLKVRNSYLHELKNNSANKQIVTDKMPQNFLYVGLIFKTLPEAKIIHVKRHPAATCWSNFKHYFSAKGLGYSYDLHDTVAYFRMYQELMEFWEQQYGGKIYHLDYERLTVEQEIETKKLIEHLELPWEDACLSPQKNKRRVRTASKQQVRKKVYAGSSETWRKYEKFLNGSFETLDG